MWRTCGGKRSKLVLAPEMRDCPPVPFARPAGSRLSHSGGLGRRQGNLRGHRHQFLYQEPGTFGTAPPFRERHRLEDPHAAVKRHSHHIPQSNGVAGGIDTLAIDPNMAGNRQGRSGGARAHHPGMPEPLVYALAIQCESPIAAPLRWPRAAP